MIKSVENIISNLLPIYSDNSNWSSNKDIFDARLQSYNLHTELWLFGAVIGEVELFRLFMFITQVIL